MKVVNFLLTFFAIFLSVPAILILISWNALPGDRLYGLKTGLEDLVAISTSKTPLAQKFSVTLTERRFSEANKLLTSQGSVVGFSLLVEEAQASKEIIVDKSDAETGGELLAKVEEYQETIEQYEEALGVTPISPVSTAPSPVDDTGDISVDQNMAPVDEAPSEGAVVPTAYPTPTRQQPSVPAPSVQPPSSPSSSGESVEQQPTVPPVEIDRVDKTRVQSLTPQQKQVAAVALAQANQKLEKIKAEVKRELPKAEAHKIEKMRKEREKKEKRRKEKEEKEQEKKEEKKHREGESEEQSKSTASDDDGEN